MPRRPRPQSRRPPQPDHAEIAYPVHKELRRTHSSSKHTPVTQSDGEDTTSEGESSDISQHAPSRQEYALNSEEEDDVDAPRVVQWAGEDELDGEESETPEKEDFTSLQNDLSSLPLGALRKAQQTLGRAEVESDSGSDSESDGESEGDKDKTTHSDKARGKQKEWNTRPRTDLKRANKHAPTEITSKKPTTRRRTVVEDMRVHPRDPRFLPLAGEYSSERFSKQYDFLLELHETEAKTLRENLKRARTLLASSPRDLRGERDAEVRNLEAALKRAESAVHKDRRDRVEQEALNKFSQEEKERRKQGKGAWYLKKSDKKELLVRARYDALAQAGGKSAVKRAIEKKQKKISQKEKKSRPFAARSGHDGTVGEKRSQRSDDGGPRKRPRH